MKLIPALPKAGAIALLCLTGAMLTLTLPQAYGADLTPAVAVADASRPAEDKARDADRKPAEMLAFAQIKPGQTVIDFIPGKGYFTRLFSAATGAQGAVYADTPQFLIDRMKKTPPSVSAEAGRGNVHDVVASAASLNVPVKADLVWTSQNYHDVHIFMGAEGVTQLNKAAFDALKPGGLYIVLDHAGPGLDHAGMSKLHRIDESLVKKEVLAAGFVLDGESQVLRNPADTHTVNVYDPAIRARTDQFVLRFKKPGA